MPNVRDLHHIRVELLTCSVNHKPFQLTDLIRFKRYKYFRIDCQTYSPFANSKIQVISIIIIIII